MRIYAKEFFRRHVYYFDPLNHGGRVTQGNKGIVILPRSQKNILMSRLYQ
jgi:hypothetical protein